jgi:hypothetical protein
MYEPDVFFKDIEDSLTHRFEIFKNVFEEDILLLN